MPIFRLSEGTGRVDPKLGQGFSTLALPAFWTRHFFVVVVTGAIV